MIRWLLLLNFAFHLVSCRRRVLTLSTSSITLVLYFRRCALALYEQKLQAVHLSGLDFGVYGIWLGRSSPPYSKCLKVNGSYISHFSFPITSLPSRFNFYLILYRPLVLLDFDVALPQCLRHASLSPLHSLLCGILIRKFTSL